MGRLHLTRETILDGTLHASVRAILGQQARFMSDAERAAQVQAILARAPRPDRIWVFGFGSLMWNPTFHFVERRTARIHGFHRRFCLWSRAGRGSPDRPGLMLSLEAGGSCTGVVYRLSRRAVATELDVLWRREMFTMAYRPLWTTAYTSKGPEPAIAFTVNREHERYAPALTDEVIARYLASGAGPIGRCCDYLFETTKRLRELGLRDRRLEMLEAKVRALGVEN